MYVCTMGAKLALQAFKGITDNVRHARGKGLDIHLANGKLRKPKKGWTLSGHN